jgi:hypothetical protein
MLFFRFGDVFPPSELYDSFSSADNEEKLTYKLELTHFPPFRVHIGKIKEGRAGKFCG